MSAINLQCGDRCELYGVSFRFVCQRPDYSIDMVIQRADDLDAPDRELQQQLDKAVSENARLTARLARYETDRVNDAIDQMEARREEPRNIPCDPFQNPDAWRSKENCTCGRYTGGHNPCQTCREVTPA